MRELCTSDIGVKFFCQNPNKSNGSRSIVYKAHSIEEGNGKYFFFRRDEVVSSFENLFYMMGYGDMMAEIIIDDDTVKNAQEASPEHYGVDRLVIGEIYDCDSEKVKELIQETIDNDINFDADKFITIVSVLIEKRALNNAIKIYENNKGKVNLTKQQNKQIMELSLRGWIPVATFKDTIGCESLQEWISLLKERI